MPDRTTAVIGGGMAGCAATRELLRAGRRVTLLEASDGLGGRARSWHRAEIFPDTGINLWFTSLYRTLLDRIHEYGLQDQMVSMQNRMIVIRDGRPAPLASDSTRTLLTYPHVNAGERMRFLWVTLRETLRRSKLDIFDVDKLAAFDDGRTAAEWARARLSERILDNLIRPEIESYWLWRLDEVSAAHAMAMQANVVGARFYVLGPGMEAVAERMAEGATVRLDAQVTGIERDGDRLRVSWSDPEGAQLETFDEVVLAVTGQAAARLARPLGGELVDPDLLAFAESQRYEPAISISYLIDRGVMPSGAHLVPGGPGPHPVRAIITVPKQELTPEGRRDRELVFVYPGRQETADLLEASEERRYEESRRLARRLWPDFPRDAAPFHIVERRIGLAMPEPGRYRRASALGRRQRGPVVFAGDFLGSPTAESSMRTGVRAAAALLAGGRVRAPVPREPLAEAPPPALPPREASFAGTPGAGHLPREGGGGAS